MVQHGCTSPDNRKKRAPNVNVYKTCMDKICFSRANNAAPTEQRGSAKHAPPSDGDPQRHLDIGWFVPCTNQAVRARDGTIKTGRVYNANLTCGRVMATGASVQPHVLVFGAGNVVNSRAVRPRGEQRDDNTDVFQRQRKHRPCRLPCAVPRHRGRPMCAETTRRGDLVRCWSYCSRSCCEGSAIRFR